MHFSRNYACAQFSCLLSLAGSGFKPRTQTSTTTAGCRSVSFLLKSSKDARLFKPRIPWYTTSSACNFIKSTNLIFVAYKIWNCFGQLGLIQRVYTPKEKKCDTVVCHSLYMVFIKILPEGGVIFRFVIQRVCDYKHGYLKVNTARYDSALTVNINQRRFYFILSTVS